MQCLNSRVSFPNSFFSFPFTLLNDQLISQNYFFFYTFTECEITIGCDADYDVYSHVDCDGDGILDHACRTTINENHWLILSSEGCPNDWGASNRSVSECPAAWPSKGNKWIGVLISGIGNKSKEKNRSTIYGKCSSNYLKSKKKQI